MHRCVYACVCSVDAAPGHSSMPLPNSAPVLLSKAVAAIAETAMSAHFEVRKACRQCVYAIG